MTDRETGTDRDHDRRSVRATYDHIADHFAQTRHHAWPEVEDFLADRWGSIGLDVGCGNGRHSELLADHVDRTVGIDVSRPLLEIANERVQRADYLQGDATSLPVANRCIDLAIYVATLPHLPTRNLRLRSLDELARVLVPGGRALVSAWSTAHDRFDEETCFDTEIDWTLPDGEVVPRFYHIYDPAEFERDLAESDLVVEETFVSSGNCYGVVGPEE